MEKQLIANTVLGGLLLLGVGLSDLFAHKDELAARRFKELSPETVTSPEDKSRNKRWHTTGLWLRVAVAVVIAALVGWALRNALAGLFAAGILGFSVALWFDVLFNLRFGQKWDYTGTTSEFDIRSNGRRQAYVEAAGIVLSAVLWKVFI